MSSACCPPEPCRVLIADDHPVVRAAFRCLLEASPKFKVVAEAADGEEALAKIEELGPDVALVDVAMPKLNGVEVARRVASARHRTRVLALTAFEDSRFVRESLTAGAAGYVPKSAAATDLFQAIESVTAGGIYVHPRLMGAILEKPGRVEPEDSALSSRESEVLRLIALGFSNKEIAHQLSISVKTVETYKSRAMEKIGATSRVDIVKFAAIRGWLGSGGLKAETADLRKQRCAL